MEAFVVRATMPDDANHPPQHFEMNEAWILSGSREQTEIPTGDGPLLTDQEDYADGKRKQLGADTETALDVTFGHRDRLTDGGKEYELGRRVKPAETHWTPPAANLE
jgi:hypothetical protein